MLSHQTDWHWVRNFGQYDAYVDNDQIITVIRATNGAVELFMDKRNPAFDNVRVRQAIAMGLDRKRLSGSSSKGTAPKDSFSLLAVLGRWTAKKVARFPVGVSLRIWKPSGRRPGRFWSERDSTLVRPTY